MSRRPRPSTCTIRWSRAAGSSTNGTPRPPARRSSGSSCGGTSSGRRCAACRRRREPYECRAESRAATDGAEAWDELAHGPMASVPLPSTYYLGAQATTAENVAFRDVARMRVLLHFWPFAVPIYVPAVVDRDGSRDFVGYALVVPDIVDLEGFVADWAQVARERGTDPSGYRPRDAVVDVAAEAGLDLARRAFAVVARREGVAATQPWLNAVDVFHIEKEGNNVRVRGVSRLDLRRERVDEYARVRHAYWSAEFRRRRVDQHPRGPRVVVGRVWPALRDHDRRPDDQGLEVPARLPDRIHGGRNERSGEREREDAGSPHLPDRPCIRLRSPQIEVRLVLGSALAENPALEEELRREEGEDRARSLSRGAVAYRR